MNDRQLRYFIAVAEELSFSRAAQRLNVSQPPLSVQIKMLEDELGAQLFQRTKRSVRLTHAGTVLYEQASKAVRQMDEAGESVQRAVRGEFGTLRIGFTSSVPMLPTFGELVRTFRSDFPGVKLQLQHTTSGRQIDALRDRQLDVGLFRPSGRTVYGDGLRVLDFSRDRMLVFFPSHHRLAEATGEVDGAELMDEAFVTVAAEAGCGVREHLLELARSLSFAPRLAQECDELGMVLGFVAAGVGLSILPDSYRCVSLDGVRSRPLESSQGSSKLVLAIRSECDNRIAQNFFELGESLAKQRSQTAALAQ